MNILYLTWGETPRSYGVFGSQVISQLVENSKLLPEANFYFASAVPIVNSGLVREKWRYPAEIKSVKKKLGLIPFFLLPIYAPQNFVNSSSFSFNLFHLGGQYHLKRLVERLQPNIVHCRSYHAAWAALCIKRKCHFRYKIVFDARGLWPEEVALKKKYSSQSNDYLFLKNIEQDLLNNCDYTIAVSDPMQCHLESLGAKQIGTVYLSADSKKLAYDDSGVRAKTKVVEFCYVGALSDDTWHKPEALKSLFVHIKKLIPGARLTIVTTSDHLVIEQLFLGFGSDITIKSTKTTDELGALFKTMDFGLMSYFKPESEREVMLSRMVLAVKTAEYLIAGLPMIVNESCGGAASLVENYGMGIVYNPETFEGLSLDKIYLLNTSKIKKGISDRAKNLFDYKNHAIKYVDVYKRLSACS